MSISERKLNLLGVNEKLDIFLKVMIKNKCLDKIKVENNRKSILNGIKHFFNRYEQNNERIEIDFRVLLNILPEQQKTIFELHLNGFDNQAIAEKLNLSYNTVRNTLSTSKKKLRYLWHKFM